MLALTKALTVVKKVAKAEQEANEKAQREEGSARARSRERRERQKKAGRSRERDGDKRSGTARSQEDVGKPSLRCSHPDCRFAVHTNPSVSASFCCGLCSSAFLEKPQAKPKHGTRCERKSPEKGAKRADPEKTSGDKKWGDDHWKQWNDAKPEKADREDKGKGKGKDRTEKAAPLPGEVSADPAEIERRQKRAARFGQVERAASPAAEAKPRAPRPAESATSTRERQGKGKGKGNGKERKPEERQERTNADERRQKPPVGGGEGLRSWSDDDQYEHKERGRGSNGASKKGVEACDSNSEEKRDGKATEHGKKCESREMA